MHTRSPHAEEVQAFLEACGNSRDRAFFTLLYEADLRIAEAGTLTWKQIEFDSWGAVLNTDGKYSNLYCVLRIRCIHDTGSNWVGDLSEAWRASE